MTRPDNDQTVTIQEAAIALGISVEAVRKRLARGTLKGYKAGRTWYVILPERPDSGQTEASAFVDALKDEIMFLRQQLANKDVIIQTLASRVPELPPGREDKPHRRRWWPFGGR